ncbi:hypothetical protein FOL47_008972 [Perkinsus chesapeaki]|uniref:Calcineurin-like phosphoesterase domain-containing protein n=1 Tax=Perkinsus chesapeaki TaxID=330153 RepID=A0A7J6N2E2_PERCH|nr:hypothetical protein FOL47_008972 [Perkinsus chesapeaki]
MRLLGEAFVHLFLLILAAGAGHDSNRLLTDRLESADPRGFTFLSIGDWGDQDTSRASANAQQMNSIVQQKTLDHPVEFVASLGDNFYEDGVKDRQDDRFKRIFDEVFESRSPLNTIPWYITLGNHDYRKSADAQLLHSAYDYGGTWKMPAYWYSVRVDFGYNDKDPQEKEYAFFVFFDTWRFTKDEKQLGWLERTLLSGEAQNATWLVAVSHVPAYSIGNHGKNQTVIDNIMPIFEKAKVDAYISGHDHDMQVLTANGGAPESGTSIVQIICGAGSRQEPVGKNPDPKRSKWSQGMVNGFCEHTMDESNFVTRFVSGDNGSTIHTLTQPPRQDRRTAKVRDQSIGFLSLGDWGDVTGGLSATSKMLKSTLATRPWSASTQFIALIGDNFYENGVSGLDDSQFEDTFEKHMDFGSNLPWYAVLGNHDYRQDATAQMIRTRVNPSGRWQMPGKYFSPPIFRSGLLVSVCAVFIDTQDLYQEGQLRFLRARLASDECQQATFIVVFGHHPVYSVGWHGDNDHMVRDVLPLLKRYSVDLYVAGHDHDLQWLQEDTLSFVVSGAASKERQTNYNPDHKRVAWSQGNVHGFTRHLATSSGLVTDFIESETGAVLKSFSIPARSQPRVSSCPTCESPVLKQEDLGGVVRASLSPRMPNMNVSIYIVIALVLLSCGFGALLARRCCATESVYEGSPAPLSGSSSPARGTASSTASSGWRVFPSRRVKRSKSEMPDERTPSADIGRAMYPSVGVRDIELGSLNGTNRVQFSYTFSAKLQLPYELVINMFMLSYAAHCRPLLSGDAVLSLRQARGFASLTRKQLRKQQKLGLDKPVGQETKLVESDWKDAWTENLPRWAQKRRDYVDRIQIPASWKWWGVLSLTPLFCAPKDSNHQAIAVHMIPALTEDTSENRTKTGRYWMQDKSDSEIARHVLSACVHYTSCLLVAAGAPHWGLEAARYAIPLRNTEYNMLYGVFRFGLPAVPMALAMMTSRMATDLPREALTHVMLGFLGIAIFDCCARVFSIVPRWWLWFRLPYTAAVMGGVGILLLSERNLLIGKDAQLAF